MDARDQRDAESARIGAELRRLSGGTDPFATAVRATRMPMIITNPRLADNPVVFVNDAFCRLSGYARDEILGRNCRFLQGPETDPATVRRIHDAVAAVRAIEIDIRNHRKSGEPFWNRLLLAPVRDLAGELAYFFASQVDVTIERERLAGLEQHNAALAAELADRLRAQEDSEQRLRFATEAGRLGVWELDRAGGGFSCSALCRLLFGRDPALPFGRADLHAAVHPDDRAQAVAALDEALASGAGFDRAFRVLRPGGGVGWIHMRAQSVRDDGGTPLRLAGIALDITAQKRAETALQRLNRRLEAAVTMRTAERDRLWQLSRDLIVVLDAEGLCRSVNPAWASELGHAEDDVIGARFDSFVHADDRAVLPAGPAQDRAECEVRVRTRDGSFRWVRWLMMAEGDRRYCSGRDVTASRGLEDQLRQSQKMEAVGQLTGGIAHDFNNMLTGISGALDFIRRRIADGRIHELGRYLDLADASAQRAAALTHRLLAFARRQPLQPGVVDVNRLVASMDELLRRSLGEQVVLEATGADDLWLTRCDRHQLENALLNLVINARDAMPNGGRLTIAASNARLDAALAARQVDVRPGRYVCLAVSDSGEGIPADMLPRVFEPFFTTKPLGQGTGLGLSMVYGFARQSGGNVRIYSEPGQGTTVRLFLPRHEGPAAPPMATEPTRAQRAVAGETILVIEDDGVVRGLVGNALRDLGYRVLPGADAAAALPLLERPGRLDLLVTDIGLPGLNGRALAARARALRPGLPVLFMTGYAGDGAEAETASEPGTPLLAKPFAIDALAAEVRALIDASR